MHNTNIFCHSKELLESCKILNVYRLNLLNMAVFMHEMKNRTFPSSILEKFKQTSHSYPLRFSCGNYRTLKIMQIKISNDLVRSAEKEIQLSFF